MLFVAGLGIFMVFLDTQVLFVAFDDIRRSFPQEHHDAVGAVRLHAGSPPLCPLAASPTGGSRTFLGGLVVFTVASALCGWPRRPAGWWRRVVQALGAAATPTSLALVLRATLPARPIAVPSGVDGRWLPRSGRRSAASWWSGRLAPCSS